MKQIFTALVFLLFLLNSVIAQDSTSIKFEKLTYEKAILKAKTTGKLVYIYFTDPICSGCKKMENTVFKSVEVCNVFNSSFINIKIEDSPSLSKVLKKKLNLNRIPTHLFVNAKEEIEHKVTGPLDIAQMVEMGNLALNKNENMLALKKEFKTNPTKMANDRLLRYVMILYYASENYKPAASFYFNTINDEDFNKPEVLSTTYMLTSDVNSREFGLLIRNSRDFNFGPTREEFYFHINEMLTRYVIDIEKANPKIAYNDTLTRLCHYLSYKIEQPLIQWSELTFIKEISKDQNEYYIRLYSFLESFSTMIPLSRKLDIFIDISENCKELNLKESSLRWLQFAFEQNQNPEILLVLAYSMYNFGRPDEAKGMINTAEQFAKDLGVDISEDVLFYKKKMNMEEEKK